MSKAWFNLTLVILSVSLLPGCVSSRSLMMESDKPAHAAPISIEQLLAQAESGNTSTAGLANNAELILRFEGDSVRLTPEQENQLHRFANLHNTLVKVDCAPSNSPDPFIAASLAISRCNRISTFLSVRARKTIISLSPDRLPNHTYISQ